MEHARAYDLAGQGGSCACGGGCACATHRDTPRRGPLNVLRRERVRQEALEGLIAGEPVAAIAARLGVSRATIYRLTAPWRHRAARLARLEHPDPEEEE